MQNEKVDEQMGFESQHPGDMGLQLSNVNLHSTNVSQQSSRKGIQLPNVNQQSSITTIKSL